MQMCLHPMQAVSPSDADVSPSDAGCLSPDADVSPPDAGCVSSSHKVPSLYHCCNLQKTQRTDSDKFLAQFWEKNDIFVKQLPFLKGHFGYPRAA